jgi:hypothetical protein
VHVTLVDFNVMRRGWLLFPRFLGYFP